MTARLEAVFSPSTAPRHRRVGGECSAAGPALSGTPAVVDNARGQVADPAADPMYVACRCGRRHQVRDHAVACSHCAGPTFDHHAVCGRCRGKEPRT